MKKILFLGFILALLSTAASAQRGKDMVRKGRVAEGIRSKELTRGEVMQLRATHTHKKIAQRRAMRDGRITPLERHRLHKLDRRENRRIFMKKHNSRRRLI